MWNYIYATWINTYNTVLILNEHTATLAQLIANTLGISTEQTAQRIALAEMHVKIDEQAIVMNEQAATLANQASTLSMQGAILTEQTAMLEEQRTTLDRQSVVMLQILAKLTPASATRVVFLGLVDGVFREVTSMKMGPMKQCPVVVAFKNDAGGIAQVDGIPVWTNDNDSIVGMHVADDGMSALITTPHPDGFGKSQISVTADAALSGDEIREIVGTLLVEATGSEATMVELEPGEITDLQPMPKGSRR